MARPYHPVHDMRALAILLLALAGTANAADPECIDPIQGRTEWDGTDGALAYCTPANSVTSCTVIFAQSGVFASLGVKNAEPKTKIESTHVLEGTDTYKIRCSNDTGTVEWTGNVAFTDEPVPFPDPPVLL